MGYIDDSYQNDSEITEADCWTVISSFFEEKGLVSQQLDSFDDFMKFQISDLVTDQSRRKIEITSTNQYTMVNNDYQGYKHQVLYGHISIQSPVVKEPDSKEPTLLWPQFARLRNLTYAASVLMDVTYKKTPINIDGTPDGEPIMDTNERQLLCKVPVMIRSCYCRLNGLSADNLAEQGECIYDSGGYFIIGGNEKVLIAQERQTNNTVFVFKRDPRGAISWTAEVRSVTEDATRPASVTKLLMYSRKASKKMCERYMIHAAIPSFITDVPVCVVFRA
ncbi:hypothetical protein WA158_007936, partial [Blastocystis sp. Blastoise]